VTNPEKTIGAALTAEIAAPCGLTTLFRYYFVPEYYSLQQNRKRLASGFKKPSNRLFQNPD
jgi:hypothetical protein